MRKPKSKYKNFFENAAKSMSAESIQKAEMEAKKIILNLRLKELREQLGIRQEDLKGFSQSHISRIEGRSDMKLSTLIEYLKSLGMGIQIVAKSKKSKGKEVTLLIA